MSVGRRICQPMMKVVAPGPGDLRRLLVMHAAHVSLEQKSLKWLVV